MANISANKNIIFINIYPVCWIALYIYIYHCGKPDIRLFDPTGPEPDYQLVPNRGFMPEFFGSEPFKQQNNQT